MQNSPRVPHPHQTPASLHRLPLSKRQSGTPKTIPDSFDEIAMGVFRQTWHVVMNPQTEEGLPPDFKWTTACGRRFHPDSFFNS